MTNLQTLDHMDEGFDSFEELNNLYLQTKQMEDMSSLEAKQVAKIKESILKDESAANKTASVEVKKSDKNETKGILGEVTNLLESVVVDKK